MEVIIYTKSFKGKMIKIGTSGYSFQDWKGVFYPQDIDKGKMLDFYAKHFDTVEINSTYYRIPHPLVFYKIAHKTPGDFEFIVKTHKNITHTREDIAGSANELKQSIRPLAEALKMHGFLAQFPWSFRRTDSNLDYLKKCRELFGDFPFFVEFRHKSWVEDRVFEFLRNEDIGFCCVDEPQLEGLVPPVVKATTQVGYIRFHGRNKDGWWKGAKDRYDYLYTEEELKDWLERIKEIRQLTRKAYLFFNNCTEGQAVRNAQMMKGLLKEAK
jgi:uncharacterized protein YecE (DUF72 family)